MISPHYDMIDGAGSYEKCADISKRDVFSLLKLLQGKRKAPVFDDTGAL